jgi:nascent polypeptide-associated complex subunit alpha
MFGGVDPKKMQGMMKKMGIAQENMPVNKVIFELENKTLIIEEPQVTKITMQGQETYQVLGETKEEETESISEEDIEMVAEKTGTTKEEAKKALEETEGDIAEAIVNLSN